MLPTFLIVGAEKAGTTTLAGMLAEHPEVYVSTPKELRFFRGRTGSGGLHGMSRVSIRTKRRKRLARPLPPMDGAPRAIMFPDGSPEHCRM